MGSENPDGAWDEATRRLERKERSGKTVWV